MANENVYDIYRNLDRYNFELTNKKIKLEEYKRNNAELKDNINKLNKVNELMLKLREFINVMNLFYKVSAQEDINYKNRRINFLSNYIDKNLAVIFPEENFKSEIVCDFKYLTNKATLKLRDESNNVRIPEITEGKLCQELISFSSALGIVESLGKNKVYMDEAFAASSAENLAKVSSLLLRAVENGTQVILIEQTNNGYKDIPRREFKLYKDPMLKMVQIESVTDY